MSAPRGVERGGLPLAFQTTPTTSSTNVLLVILYHQLDVQILSLLYKIVAVLAMYTYHTSHTFRKHRSLLKPYIKMHCIWDSHFEGISAVVHDEQRNIYERHITTDKPRAARFTGSIDARCKRPD